MKLTAKEILESNTASGPTGGLFVVKLLPNGERLAVSNKAMALLKRQQRKEIDTSALSTLEDGTHILRVNDL